MSVLRDAGNERELFFRKRGCAIVYADREGNPLPVDAGMAAFAEGRQICRVVVRPVAVEVVDVQVGCDAADGAAVSVAFEDLFPESLPCLQGILLPHGNPASIERAYKTVIRTPGTGAVVTEPPVAVPAGLSVA